MWAVRFDGQSWAQEPDCLCKSCSLAPMAPLLLASASSSEARAGRCMQGGRWEQERGKGPGSYLQAQLPLARWRLNVLGAYRRTTRGSSVAFHFQKEGCVLWALCSLRRKNKGPRSLRVVWPACPPGSGHSEHRRWRPRVGWQLLRLSVAVTPPAAAGRWAGCGGPASPIAGPPDS